ncbi:hypothetical protein RMHFA_05620 (plasmid) [Roseomonas mucosa]|nr:hypothetical protein RMHFA_05620 [Roseomonas mucosa]
MPERPLRCGSSLPPSRPKLHGRHGIRRTVAGRAEPNAETTIRRPFLVILSSHPCKAAVTKQH